MNPFLEQHHDLLKRITEAKVDFILVGGYAVNFHGYGRATGDIDLLVRPDNPNFAKLFDVLEEMGFNKDDLAILRKRDYTKVSAFHFWEPPLRVDVLSHISGVKYEDAALGKQFGNFEGLKVPFLHINHLIAAKTATGRPQDKADVEILQEIRNKGNKKD